MAAKAMLRVVEREARVFARLWRGSLFSSAVAPALFLGAMGLGLGGLVDERSGPVDGLPYLEFLAPGLLVATAMQSAAQGSLWPVMAGMRWVRMFHGIVATPVTAADVYGGYVVWIALRAALFACVFLLVAALLGGVSSVLAVLAVPVAGLCALAFAAPMTAFAATQESDVTFPVLIRLGVMPMFLFSGTFFPVSQLPAGLQPLAVLSPLWHAVELARGATSGRLDAVPAGLHVLALAAVIALGWRWGTRAFARQLTP